MRRIESVTKAYHSTRQKGLKKFESRTTTATIDTGEGAHVHGWGLYLQADEMQNRKDYLNMFTGESNNEVVYAVKFNGKNYTAWSTEDWCSINDYVMIQIYTITPSVKDDTELALNFLLNGLDGEDVMNAINETDDSELLNHWDISDIESAATLIGNNTDYNVEELPGNDPEPLPDGTHYEKASQYTVEIPDDMFFIDEDSDVPSAVYKKWYEYLKTVDEYYKKAIREDEEWLADKMRKFNGRRFYESMSYVLGSQEKASLWLSEHGVDGMTYEGGRDGGCFVIYNCDKLKIVGEY